MNDITNLERTTKPKSDQLNADDLIAGPMNIKITNVRVMAGDQPIFIDSEGIQPFKPCKTMRRLLIMAWGNDGNAWVGKSMTLYNDETVKWAGKAIGGIRISHLSGIASEQNFMLTTTRGKRANHTIYPLLEEDFTGVIESYKSIEDNDERLQFWNALSQAQQGAITHDHNYGTM